jgi:hypothetical protein
MSAKLTVSRAPTADEAAAIAAAIQRFRAETAPAGAEDGRSTVGPWQRAALLEGVSAKGIAPQHPEGGSKWLS